MPIYKGSGTNPGSIYVGSSSIQKVYVGMDLVWQNKALLFEFVSGRMGYVIGQIIDTDASENYIWDMGDGTFEYGSEIYHEYSDSEIKFGKVYRSGGMPTVNLMYLENFEFADTLDLSGLTKFDAFDFEIWEDDVVYNFDGVILADTVSGSLSSFVMTGTTYSGVFDLSMFTEVVDLSLDLFDNPSLTGILMNENFTGKLASVDLSNCNISGDLDLTAFTKLTANAVIFIAENPLMTDILFAEITEGGIAYMDISGSGLTSFDCTTLPWYTTVTLFDIGSCPDLTSVILPESECRYRWIYLNDSDLGYIDFTVVPNVLNRTNCVLNFSNNNMSAAEINQMLVELDGITDSGYTDRYLYLGLNNADPDNTSGGYDGLSAASSLQSKGVNVNYN